MNKKTTVVNKHSGDAYDIYIGRGSKWGNPFSHMDNTTAEFKVSTREEAVQKHREWILTQPHLLADLHELRGKVLCCFCAPKVCHGHTLAQMADALDDTVMVKTVVHIGFTGHRPDKLAGYDLSAPGYREMQDDLEYYIRRNLEVYDQVVGHSGLALGGDTIWSKAILAMKDAYPGRVLFHAEIPMMEQAEAWFKSTDIEFWHKQIHHADFKTIYGSLEECNKISDKKRRDAVRKKRASEFMDLRNKGMLNHSDMLLALHNGSNGGTGNAVAYAKEIELDMYVVHPDVYFA